MSCIDPANEFADSGYIQPIYCTNPDSKTPVSTDTKCNMWNGAVGALQCGISETTSDARNKCKDMSGLDDNMLKSGNWQTSLSQCERIQSDQVCSYGKGDIFDIQQEILSNILLLL